MREITDDRAPAGRPVRLVPTPPGFWRLLLGVVVAAFAPLFGFLLGSMTGSPEPSTAMTPLYWGLLCGFLLGGVGVIVAVVGARRLWSHYRARDMEEKTP